MQPVAQRGRVNAQQEQMCPLNREIFFIMNDLLMQTTSELMIIVGASVEILNYSFGYLKQL